MVIIIIIIKKLNNFNINYENVSNQTTIELRIFFFIKKIDFIYIYIYISSRTFKGKFQKK